MSCPFDHEYFLSVFVVSLVMTIYSLKNIADFI